jgi:pimeloyl-ACP methyl ester carboxylesterase
VTVGSEEHSVTLIDGRTIAYRCYGDPLGSPVLALHGTPGSRLKFAAFDACAAAAGMRLIAIDRWGYGLSSPHPNGTFADFGTDMVAFAERLGLDRLAIVGVSGGGPFAVAAAASLGRRAAALALVSPVGLFHRASADSKVALGWFHSLCFRVLPRVPGAIPLVFQVARLGLAVSPNVLMPRAVVRSSIDKKTMDDAALRHREIENFKAGLAFGVAGPVKDMELFNKDWNLNLSQITVPTMIWIGLRDGNIPLAAARELAMRLPNTKVRELPDDGHLWIAQNFDHVSTWLKSIFAIAD